MRAGDSSNRAGSTDAASGIGEGGEGGGTDAGSGDPTGVAAIAASSFLDSIGAGAHVACKVWTTRLRRSRPALRRHL